MLGSIKNINMFIEQSRKFNNSLNFYIENRTNYFRDIVSWKMRANLVTIRKLFFCNLQFICSRSQLFKNVGYKIYVTENVSKMLTWRCLYHINGDCRGLDLRKKAWHVVYGWSQMRTKIPFKITKKLFCV